MILRGASAHLPTRDALRVACASLCELPVLTLREPFASLVAWGVKTIETRKTGTTHRGLLAIHAGIGPELPCDERHVRRLWERWKAAGCLGALHGDMLGPTKGNVIAVVRVLDVRDLKPEDEPAACFYAAGRKAWILAADVVRVKPLAHRGAQGFSYVDATKLEPETAT